MLVAHYSRFCGAEMRKLLYSLWITVEKGWITAKLASESMQKCPSRILVNLRPRFIDPDYLKHMHPRNLAITDFTYELPEKNIAYYPLAERDQSKLIVYKEQIIAEDIYRNIAHYIPSNSVIVFNNTRVVEARLRFRKPTGGEIEIFCLEPGPDYADISSAMQQKGAVRWRCLIGGASKWKAGQVLEKEIESKTGTIKLEARYLQKEAGSFLVALSWSDPELSFAEILHLAGSIPLPPYIKREAEASDSERYQTIYAKAEGSVAAPTAGLHFTESVMESLREKGIETAFTTLHVGAGTFQPVKAERMEDHAMHSEFIEVSRSLLQTLFDAKDKNLVAVGTTSLRTLESIYWLGVQALQNKLDPEKGLGQWEVYDELPQDIEMEMSLKALMEWMDTRGLEKLITRTRLLVAPGYKLRMIKTLVTNFHQPASTLLLLVAAIIGPGWKELYEEAIRKNYRFLSYGDGMMIG